LGFWGIDLAAIVRCKALSPEALGVGINTYAYIRRKGVALESLRAVASAPEEREEMHLARLGLREKELSSDGGKVFFATRAGRVVVKTIIAALGAAHRSLHLCPKGFANNICPQKAMEKVLIEKAVLSRL
jgi:hypothetical protein